MSLTFWLKILLFVSSVLAVLLVGVKASIFLFKKRKIAFLVYLHRSVWGLFLASYYSLLALILGIMFDRDLDGTELVRNRFAFVVVLVLGILFQIGPLRGMLGIKATRKQEGDGSGHENNRPRADILSGDGWMIEAWPGGRGWWGKGESDAPKERETIGKS